ncbi:uncharacterized protein LOC128739255 [Sabethes cyaneus]|uniref:uncharacterized protein LOC128739255 n=1 Tax=Sabethes cyaneus TaxID=53552 RepID=UPI00237DEA64|nr:uncharacterized protein LOC128739255 [Sabethes cyaneus]
MQTILTDAKLITASLITDMPFAVVETTNARGHNELSAVPEKWIRSSKSGNIMLWHNSQRVQDVKKMLRDANITPKKAWLKYKCTIKRNGIRSYDEAMGLCEELSGESSSDARAASSQRKKKVNQNLVSFQNMLILDSTGLPLPPVIAKLEPPVAPLRPTAAPLQLQPIPMQPPLALPQAPVTPPQAPAAPLQLQAIPMQPPVAPLETPAATTKKHMSAAHVLTDITSQDILKELMGVNHRLDLLEKRTADIAIQNEFILDALRKQNSRTMIEEHLEFCFKPIEREEELADLELNLEDNDYKSKIVKWLRVHYSGDCADNRMLRVLDLLISKEMQTKCTWTGASRKGPKVAIMPNRNMLQLFVQIGSDDSEVVTHQKLTRFFMRKLKNSLKRLTTTGKRRGTKHVRKKKADNEVVEGESAPGLNKATSDEHRPKHDNKPQSQVVEDPYTGSNDASSSGQQAAWTDEQDNSCSDFGSESDAGSVVDSSDALDNTDMVSDTTE